MRIFRILNNNAVVVVDGPEEKIVMGKGIAFGKRSNDIIPKDRIEKIFTMQEKSSEKFQQLLSTLPERHIDLAERIISKAEKELAAPLSDHIHIALTDHLSFALERMAKGLVTHNKLLNEIRTLYRKEFEIGLWAKQLIKEETGVEIPDDEVAHIALHIHTAKMDTPSMMESLKQATVMQYFIELLEAKLGVAIEEHSIDYQRLITHLRFALHRLENGETFHPIDDDMLVLIQQKYETAYRYAKEIMEKIEAEEKYEFPPSEIAYIALHIHRLMK